MTRAGSGGRIGPAVNRLRAAPSSWSGGRLAIGAVGVLVAVVLVAYPYLFASSFWRNTGILALIFATAGVAWNVLGGYAGQVSFGNAVFFGAGAYPTALLVRAGWSPWPTFAIGAAVAAAAALLIGLPCFRLRSHYFAIATIAAGEIAFIVVNSNETLGASSGLSIPLKPSGLATLQFSARNPTPYYYVALVLLALCLLLVWGLVRARTGLYLRAIRDNEEAAAAAGVPVWRYKLIAVTVSAVISALAGSVYVMYTLFVDPSLVLDLTVSIDIVLITVLGGAGTLFGPVIGAWVLTVLQEYTRQRFGGAASGLDLLIFGTLIVAVVAVEPGGIASLGRRGWEWLQRRAGRRSEAGEVLR